MIATLLLGSNQGDSNALLCAALEMIEQQAGSIVKKTSVTTSDPWGFDSKNMFYNQAVEIETSLEPLELLDLTEDIERRLGRVKKAYHWRRANRKYVDRTMDIDILYYGATSGRVGSILFDHQRLMIPHPQIANRPFTLAMLDMLSKEQ